MTRWANTPNETAAAASNTPLRLLVDLDFVSGMVYAHAGVGELVWNGNVYPGLGTYGGFQTVNEEAAVNPKPVTLTLSAIPSELLASSMAEVYQGRPVTLWWGMVDPLTDAWVANPEVLWSGVMDTMSVDIGPLTGNISLVCEDPDYCQPLPRRYTLQDHQLDFAGDLGLSFLSKIPGYKGNWGAAGFGYGTLGGSGVTSPPFPTFGYGYGRL